MSDELRVLPSGEPPTGQIAWTVPSLEDALPRWIDLGIGPWNVWTFDGQRLPVRTYYGAPGAFEARVALCSLGATTYELVEPITGPSIWDDVASGHAQVHHLGYYVDDIDAAIAAMEGKGYAMVQYGAGFGLDGDGAFAYFDATATTGCFLEAILGPRALPDPDQHISL